jgi:hypothetical protein
LEARVWSDAIIEVVLKWNNRNVADRVLRCFDDRCLQRGLLRRRQLIQIGARGALGAAEASGDASGELCGRGDVCAMTDRSTALAASGAIANAKPNSVAKALPLINVGMRGLQSGMRFSSIECLPLG